VFQYDGTLSVRTLLPAEHELTVVGGPGYEFFNLFDKRNYPVAAPGRLGEAREAGNWRIEVSPKRPAASDTFLHVLQVGGTDPVEARLISDGDEKLAGVLIQGEPEPRIVMLTDAPLPATYEVPSGGAAWHMVAGLAPELRVRVEVNGRVVATAKSNNQGVVVFRDAAEGKRRIRVLGE
jgi:hypothetical protein